MCTIFMNALYEASQAGDNTMEDIADEEAMEIGEDDKQFEEEQRNLNIEEVSSYMGGRRFTF